MKESDIRIIQNYLKNEKLYTGQIDGKRGSKTDAAVLTALTNRSQLLPNEWQNWPERRKAIAFLQVLCKENNIDAGKIDGLYGPQTGAAADQLKTLYATGSLPRSFSDIVPLRVNPHDFPVETSDSLTDFYGAPGNIPLVKVTCPWTLRLDWNLATTTRTISIHEKLSDSLSTILERLYQTYGENGIKQYGLDRYGGSYNHRKKRGSLATWSTHAWGIAIDWYPSRNKLSWRSDRASLAHPDLDAWWKIWEEEGWLSLGRTEDRDWMHVQAAKR